jgi:predicted glutamine amidotransferase
MCPLNAICANHPVSAHLSIDEGLHAMLAEVKGPDERALLVPTEPLTRDETWRSIRGIEVFSAGRRIRPAEAA